MIPTRDGYGKALVEIGEDERVVVLDADLSESTRTAWFAKKYPDRFFNMGISEQDMIGTAAGLATCGKIPFATSFAVFVTGRAYDQIRMSIAYPNLNVRLVGSHSGLLTGADGASHQALEDIALMRSLPNMTVIQPADAVEAEKATKALVKYKGPVYLRLVRDKVPIIFHDDYNYKIGKAVILNEGENIAILATGAMVHEALKAAQLFKKIKPYVINIHTIKPLDSKLILKIAKEVDIFVTVEDHSIIGGLGSAVTELLAEKEPKIVKCIGVNDKFGESGNPKELYKKYGIDSISIVRTITKMVKLI